MKHPLAVLWVITFFSSMACGFVMPSRLDASETRVDSLGGLTTIVTDETADLNLFLDGNPAALALLPPQSRLDLSGQWADSTFPPPALNGGIQEQTLSTFPRAENKDIGYQGWLGFLSSQWALQVAGDLDNPRNQPAFSELDQYNQADALALFRTALNWGPLAFGIETSDRQTNQTFAPGAFNNDVNVLSGTTAENQWILKTGIVAHWNEGDSPLSPRWQLGGFFETGLTPDDQTQALSVFYPSQSPFELQRLYKLNQNNGTVEIYYESPQSLQLRLSASTSSLQTSFSQTVPSPSPDFQTLPAYSLSNDEGLTLTGATKIRIHFSDVDLKIGAAATCGFLTEKLFQSGGSLLETDQHQQVQTALGIGLEAPEDYLVGLQFQSENNLGGSFNPLDAGAAGQADPNLDSYQIALGGEKWISPEWALRIGILNEIDVERFGAHLQTLASSVVGGAGLREDGFLLDAKLLLGEVFPLNDASIPDTSQTEFELSGTFFL
jgi:hypothetical protein